MSTGDSGHGRPLVFGEVLFDEFPDGSVVAGGAPFNVAWHLAAFGANPLFVSRVGSDALGERIRALMADWGMDPAGLQIDHDHATGTVQVSITDGEPRYRIVPDRAWDHIDADALPPLQKVGLLYHGSLALRTRQSALALAKLVTRLPRAGLLDVNLRPPWWRPDRVLADIARADWVKLNRGELEQLVPGAADEAAAVATLQAHDGPRLVVVTHGAGGATAWRGSTEPLRSPATKPVAVVDTVGAGDAHASVLLLGRCRGWDLATTLTRAHDFAAAMVGVRGATVADPAFYAPFKSRWELP